MAEQSPLASRFRPGRFAAWSVVALISAVGVAWLAVRAEAAFAPVLLFPALVGLALATPLVVGLRWLAVAHRASTLAGAVIAAAALVGCQHYFSYLAAQRHVQARAANLNRAGAAFPELAARMASPAATFPEFLRDSASRGTSLAGVPIAGTGVWLLWNLNAGITIGVVAVVVALALARPFCDSCGSWYRVSRSGQIDALQATAIAAIAGVANLAGSRAAYRLWTCRSGCGPTGCELSWNVRRPRPRVAWLAGEARSQVAAILDRGGTAGSGQTLS